MSNRSDHREKEQTPIGDPPSTPDPITVYEDKEQARDRGQSDDSKTTTDDVTEKHNANDEETMPIEEGFSTVP